MVNNIIFYLYYFVMIIVLHRKKRWEVKLFFLIENLHGSLCIYRVFHLRAKFKRITSFETPVKPEKFYVQTTWEAK